MTKRIALVKNGTVSNIAVYPDDFVPDGETTVEVTPGVEVHIGGGFSGGVFTPRPRTVPQSITKLQMVRALRGAGRWGEVKSALAQAPLVTQEDWEYAGTINRTDQVALTFASALALTDTEIDDLFVGGSKL